MTSPDDPEVVSPEAIVPDVIAPDVTAPIATPQAVRAALVRYRVMAYVVGFGLILLVLVGVPLQYAAGIPQVAQIVGPIHGAMYIIYLAAAVDLARRGQLATRQLAAIALAGFVPFLAFFVERWVTARVLSSIRDGLPTETS